MRELLGNHGLDQHVNIMTDLFIILYMLKRGYEKTQYMGEEVLRTTYGPVVEQEMRRIRSNQKLRELCKI